MLILAFGLIAIVLAAGIFNLGFKFALAAFLFAFGIFAAFSGLIYVLLEFTGAGYAPGGGPFALLGCGVLGMLVGCGLMIWRLAAVSDEF